jgi:hypothetical protein
VVEDIRLQDLTPNLLFPFTGRNNSLGLGGSAVQQLSLTAWLLHLDDAASVDDDDNFGDVVVPAALLLPHAS